MIYIRKIFNQDLEHQMAIPKEPSTYFFDADITENAEKNVVFHYFSPEDKDNKTDVKASIKGYGSECRINGDFKGFVNKNFKLQVDDILVFKNGVKNEFDFTYIKKDEMSDNLHKVLELFKENHFIYDEIDASRIAPELDSISRNRIIFGAPGTGKSKKLSIEALKFFSNNINNSDLKKNLYDEIHSQPADADQAEWITALGIKYSSYLFENYITPKKQNELVADFELLEGENQTTKKKEQLVQGAKAGYRLKLNLFPKQNTNRIERVTFHPNYTFAQFVGTYKPVSRDVNGTNEILYEYVPGPFIRTYINAIKTNEPQLLLIEEINRANVAAVFGDVFQLLDRDKNGNSEYPINISEDLKRYLQTKGICTDTLSIPTNMYIWATMNSADQGVLPMDAAFKRRWDFEYLDVDNEDAVNQIKEIEIPISRDGKKTVKWNDFRTQLNDKLSDIGVNEDKLLGPFFMSKKSLENAMASPEKFVELFESKVIMYLFEDVVKMQPGKLFTTGTRRYSRICKEFEEKGMELFGLDVEVTEVQ